MDDNLAATKFIEHVAVAKEEVGVSVFVHMPIVRRTATVEKDPVFDHTADRLCLLMRAHIYSTDGKPETQEWIHYPKLTMWNLCKVVWNLWLGRRWEYRVEVEHRAVKIIERRLCPHMDLGDQRMHIGWLKFDRQYDSEFR